jgi:hypothetical protein
MDEREARRRVPELEEHARIDVTYKYVPEGSHELIYLKHDRGYIFCKNR